MSERSRRVSFTRQFLLGPVYFSDRPPVLWWLSLGEGWMPLHDHVGINFKKKAQLLKIERQISRIWAKGTMLMIVCVLSDLT